MQCRRTRDGLLDVSAIGKGTYSQTGVLMGLVGPSSLEHLEEDLWAGELALDGSTGDHLDAFLDREAAGLRRKLEGETVSILNEDTTGTEHTAWELIYAMEGLAELDLAREEELLSNMRKPIKILKGGERGRSALNTIRRDLPRHVCTT